jgi:hypothetical protein
MTTEAVAQTEESAPIGYPCPPSAGMQVRALPASPNYSLERKQL